jgi:hypothetical protein
MEQVVRSSGYELKEALVRLGLWVLVTLVAITSIYACR